MLKITCEGVYYKNGGFVPAKDGPAAGLPCLLYTSDAADE